MLLMIHAPHERVASFVEVADRDALVGPTSHAGWTAAWMDEWRVDDALAVGSSRFVTVGETTSSVRLGLGEGSSDGMFLTWPRHTDDSPDAAVAERLASMFGAPDAAASLRDVLTEADHDLDSLIGELGRLLDLPGLVMPAPDMTVVVSRADVSVVRMACAIAGPARVEEGGGGWVLAVPAGGEGDVLAGAVSAAGRRTDRVLLAWRASPACGIQVWRRGRVEAAWEWGGRWEEVFADPLTVESQVGAALVAAAGSDAHLPTLRALLRGHSEGDPLQALTGLLGLPAAILDALEPTEPTGPGGGPGWELVPHASPGKAALSGLRSAGQRPATGRMRPLYAVYAAVTVVACIVSIAMTLLSFVVITTGGSVVDQPGIGRDDWLALVVFAGLSVVLVPTSRRRIQRLRGGGH